MHCIRDQVGDAQALRHLSKKREERVRERATAAQEGNVELALLDDTLLDHSDLMHKVDISRRLGIVTAQQAETLRKLNKDLRNAVAHARALVNIPGDAPRLTRQLTEVREMVEALVHGTTPAAASSP